MDIVQIKEIRLIGLQLTNKTSNINGQSTIDCENLWHEFHRQKYADIITNKLSDEILGVYHDYEGDNTKPFSYFIGYKVSADAIIPPGLQTLVIPAGTYQKIYCERNYAGMRDWCLERDLDGELSQDLPNRF